jgi:hypothetical protein
MRSACAPPLKRSAEGLPSRPCAGARPLFQLLSSPLRMPPAPPPLQPAGSTLNCDTHLTFFSYTFHSLMVLSVAPPPPQPQPKEAQPLSHLI